MALTVDVALSDAERAEAAVVDAGAVAEGGFGAAGADRVAGR